jgi:hypothetical protein
MNIGYFSVLDTSLTDYVRWDLLNNCEVVEETSYLRHVKFHQPLQVLMNGKKKAAVILINS